MIAPDDHLTGNVFVICRTLIVSGVIDGSLFGGASEIQIDGTVRGSLYLVGAQLNISGEIGGDIHFAGGVIDLKPTAKLSDARGSLISATLSTVIETVARSRQRDDRRLSTADRWQQSGARSHSGGRR